MGEPFASRYNDNISSAATSDAEACASDKHATYCSVVGQINDGHSLGCPRLYERICVSFHVVEG